MATRESQLPALHDALGRLAHPTETPRNLPEELLPVAATQTERRIIEGFGTLDRAAQFLDGQLSYHLQRPAPARRRTTSTDAELLTTARTALTRITAATVPLDEEYIRTRLQAMARPGPSAPAAHHETHSHTPGPHPPTPGIHR
ncbi:hypothetical protein AB0O68_30295 [Streptomyces sp. NPDC087512]|uniref:hypothetical protein n=1 Tax=Streptomyces sp. NPDC087512 TaxID=3155059 RepID=UPI00341ABDF6